MVSTSIKDHITIRPSERSSCSRVQQSGKTNIEFTLLFKGLFLDVSGCFPCPPELSVHTEAKNCSRFSEGQSVCKESP